MAVKVIAIAVILMRRMTVLQLLKVVDKNKDYDRTYLILSCNLNLKSHNDIFPIIFYPLLARNMMR